jgi:hypothetical protein
MPNARARARSVRRRAGSPAALAAGLMVAGTLACGGSTQARGVTHAVITASVQSAPATYSAGEPFAVTITFQNIGTADVSQLQLDASTGSDGVTVTPGGTLPATLPQGSSADVTWTVTAGDVGPMTISFRATGVDAGRSPSLEATAVVSLAERLAIAASAGSDGTISPAGLISVIHGGSQTFTMAPSAHHHVADVLVDGVSVGAPSSYTFADVDANHTIAARFGVDALTIAAAAGANGTVEPSGLVAVDYGGS